MLRQKKTSVLAVPTRLLQRRVTSAPTITVPISSLAQRRDSAAVAAAFVPSREQVSRLFGAEWELDVDISWRFLSALLIAPPQQQNDPRAVAALARRCKPLVGDSTSSKPRDADDGDDDQVQTSRQHQRDSLRWIKLAPFVHPAAVRAISGAVPRNGSDMRAFHLMPLMRHGDAAISLSIALASSFPSTAAASPSSSAIPRLRDAEFIASIVEMQGWRENNLIRFSERQNRDEHSADADSAASRLPPALAPPEEACVATFVAVIGAVYMQHGVDTAASLATKLAVLAAERDAK